MYSSKAPGSVMLLGEHAVVYGRAALVTSIDQYIKAKLSLLEKSYKNKIKINSSIGSALIEIDDIKNNVLNEHNKNFNFVIEVIRFFINNYRDLENKISKFELNIESDLSTEVGLGTSAAVIVAVYKVFLKFLDVKEDKKISFKNLKQIMLNIQKVGSGADIAASLYQGIVYFDGANLENIKVINKKDIENFPKVFLVYSGYKTKTPEVINLVKKNMDSIDRNIFNKIFDVIENCVQLGYKAIQEKDYNQLGKIFNIHQGLQDSLGVNDFILSEIIYSLRKDSNILGAKISGSGLGDCIIAFGNNNLLIDRKYFLDKYKIIKIKI